MSERPLIVGIGGTLRAGSASEQALRASLRAAEAAGAETALLSGTQLELPHYAPQTSMRHAMAGRLVDLVRRCDGLIVATPSYHGGISGLVKNAIDYIEDLREDERPYLDGRAVGCIVCAAGWQAVGATLSSLRSTVHALRGWPTPLGVGINTGEGGAGMQTSPVQSQLDLLGRQVMEFARMRSAMHAAAAH